AQDVLATLGTRGNATTWRLATLARAQIWAHNESTLAAALQQEFAQAEQIGVARRSDTARAVFRRPITRDLELVTPIGTGILPGCLARRGVGQLDTSD